ncbi:MAG TPA: hypothetical protein VIJ23_16230 [Mycobacterium sp.]
MTSAYPAAASSDERADRLYDLVPAIHRTRDAELGYPLRDLLRVIGTQVSVVEDDIAALYENWFIETAAVWAVPYIGDLVGYRPVSEAGDLNSASPDEVRVLVPRREVAGTIAAHRRKGTLTLLEELARDVAGWPGRGVEFARLLAVFAHLNHQHPDRGRAVDVRDVDALDRLGGPFDTLAHSVDVRRINSAHRRGTFNIPEVCVHVWRMRSYPVSWAPATCIEEVSPSSFTFSVLGNDAPLYRKAIPEPDSFSVAGEANLPVPLRPRALAAELAAQLAGTAAGAAVYGPDRTFAIEIGVRRGNGVRRQPVQPEQLVVADLTDWSYRPRRGTVAVDPVLGRLAFPPSHPPLGVWVSYRYGFSADIGGGEYPRRPVAPAPGTFYQAVSRSGPRTPGAVGSIERALNKWRAVRAEQPTAVIEILDSEVYVEPLSLTLYRGESVQIRAADRARPIIDLLDRKRNAPDALLISSPLPEDGTVGGTESSGDGGNGADHAENGHRPGGCVRLDGLTIIGRAVHIQGPLQRVEIVDCTLVPGWGLHPDCRPTRPAEPSLELYLCSARVIIERTILGSIQVYEDEVTTDPIRICISDSILDATSDDREAIGAPNWPLAHAAVSFSDCTVFGTVETHAISSAENTIFTGRVRVARRQIGCTSDSYIPPGSRTPRRSRCQPDQVEAALRDEVDWTDISATERDARIAAERQRVVPVFTSRRYGEPAYAQLGSGCANEIVRGAKDESEMGAFHDLYQPQRLANLQARLEQFTPARTDTAVLIAD